MIPDDFFRTPWHGNEVSKFEALVAAFESSWDYENGFAPHHASDFRVVLEYTNVQLVELLKLVMQQDNFEELARKADEKMEIRRQSKPMRIRRMGKDKQTLI